MVEPLGVAANLRDQSLAIIRQGLVSGEIRSGEIYSAAALASRLGISNSPVREAMLSLVNQGLMEVVRNRGFRVVELSDKQLDDIYELRVMLEVPAVANLATKINRSEEPRLRELAEACLQTAKEEFMPEFLEKDRTFHLALLALNGNDALTDIVGQLRDRSRLYGIKSLAHSGRLESSAIEHVHILDAVFAGDRDQTTSLMTKHLAHIRSDWAAASA